MKVLSVNISEKKGTVKHTVPAINLTKKGIENDAHSGNWHRQVSLLAQKSINKFSQDAGRKIEAGEFAENITTQGVDIPNACIMDQMDIGRTKLEVTQIGKTCHGTGCAIFNEVGNCVMPKEGIFCRVLKKGTIKPNDSIVYTKKYLNFKVITLSDRAYNNEYEDKSGPAIVEKINNHFKDKHWRTNVSNTLIPDDPEILKGKVKEAINDNVNIIITTGGTGIGPRDFTPDVINPMLTKTIPGIMDHIRSKYAEKIPSAVLSRSVAGLIGDTLVYTLPGSVKAVKEYMDEILKTLEHCIFTIINIDIHKR